MRGGGGCDGERGLQTGPFALFFVSLVIQKIVPIISGQALFCDAFTFFIHCVCVCVCVCVRVCVCVCVCVCVL